MFLRGRTSPVFEVLLGLRSAGEGILALLVLPSSLWRGITVSGKGENEKRVWGTREALLSARFLRSTARLLRLSN